MSPSSPAFPQSNRDDVAAFFDCLFPYADSARSMTRTKTRRRCSSSLSKLVRLILLTESANAFNRRPSIPSHMSSARLSASSPSRTERRQRTLRKASCCLSSATATQPPA
jgi:hypothetical protein